MIIKEFWSLIKEALFFAIDCFFVIWAHSPVLPLSDDRNYTNLVWPLGNNKSVRLSLFSLYLGEYAFFIFSWNISEMKISVIKKLKMSDLPTFNDNAQIEEECNQFNNHVDLICGRGNSNNYIQAEKDFLSKEIDSQTNRIARSDSKISIYSAILLALITLLWKDAYESFCASNFVGRVILGIIVYYFANICFLAIQHIGVQSVRQFSFINVADYNGNLDSFLLKKMFYNFVHKKNQARLMVSTLCRVCDFLKLIICFSIAFFVCTIISNHFPSVTNENIDSKIYVLNELMLTQAYSEDRIKLMEVEMQLEKMNFGRVVIMSKKTVQENIKKEFVRYSNQKISYLIDDSLDNNVIKILLEN